MKIMKTEVESASPGVAPSWETYWSGTAEGNAYTAGGAGHPAIRAFWEDYFRIVRNKRNAPSLLDIASGNGAVLERVLGVFGTRPVDITCVDISPTAIANIHARFAGVRGVVCDARSVPMESGTFDVITSQFGLEYAGPEAIREAARLLAEGGQLALVLHHRNGVIESECAVSLQALTGVQESGFIPQAIEMFQAGFAAVRGADRAPYDAAAARLAPAVKALEDIIKQYGRGVAANTVARLYSDVGRIHDQLLHYDSNEVLQWLSRMDRELAAYVGRMSSMVECALDENEFKAVCIDLESRGCILDQAGPLMAPGLQLPLGWVLVASRAAI